uniref:DDE Tnp4 domain-containing protein n=1 Tax=Anopheles dirus TaxID=7168 RepID=A0A182N990_9DIPT
MSFDSLNELEITFMMSNSVVAQIVNEYRAMLLQHIGLHLKRQRDQIVRMRQRFASKLSHRLHRNYVLYRRQRRRLLMDVSRLVPRCPPQRLVYNREWWNAFSARTDHEFDDEQLDDFRMDRGSFQYLLDRLKPELTPGRQAYNGAPLTAKMKMAIAIYVLGTGKNYRAAGTKFGLHYSTVHKCVYSFCRAVQKVFRESVIEMPLDASSIERTAAEFQELCGIPQIIGIIGCLHIPISQPSNVPLQYINSKGWNSVILQAVVDRNGRFQNVSCEHSGRTETADLLVNSTIYETMDQLDASGQRNINGLPVSPFLLGDNAYPLLPWLITPYPVKNKLTCVERSFNVYVTKARSCLAKTFERLLGRWKVLNRGTHIDVNFIPEVVITCCILHNIVERLESPYVDSWNECHSVEDITPEQPQWECQIVADEGEAVRNQLCRYVAENYPVIVDDDDDDDAENIGGSVLF